MSKLSLTVIFITLNEEFHIGDAIDNVKDIADEIFVVDSLSSDRTVDIALEKGAKVVQRPFTDFGDQWNFALEKLPIKTAWTMKMDPDERLTEELKDEIRLRLSSPADLAFNFHRVLYFMGKPLRHCTNLILRIWPSGHCRFSSVLVNEHPIVDLPVMTMKGKMLHYDSRDLHHWLEKQNRYTSMEAMMRFQNSRLAFSPKLFGSREERRMFLKKHFYSLPFRYTFLALYLWFKGAWRSGLVGIYWINCRIMVMKLRDLKYKEMVFRGQKIFIPRPQRRNFDQRILESELQKNLMEDPNFMPERKN